jgi:pimeloyl-ACP methyl ester carboxylesterase
VALLDHLKPDRADVVGYSMGAVVVSHLLALGNLRIRSAVLGGIGQYILAGETLVLPKGMPGMEGLSERLSVAEYSERQAQAIDRHLDGGGPASVYELFDADPRAMAAALRGTLSQATPPEELRDIQIPVLVINGTADFANQEVEHLVAAFPNARAAACDGDHLMAPFYPSFQRAIVEFLREQWKTEGK